MIISNSKVAMSSDRSFSAKSKTVSAVTTGDSTVGSSKEDGINTSFSEYKNADGSHGFSASLTTFSKAKFAAIFQEKEGINGDEQATDEVEGSKAENEVRGNAKGHRSKASKGVSQISENRDRMNLRRVREQTIMYLLLRIRQILHGEDKCSEGTSELYNISKGQGVDGYGYSGGYSVESNSANMFKATYDANIYEEQETTNYNTVGTVVTADGREINFDVELKMSRAFTKMAEKYTESHPSNAMSLVDPLVINLNDNIAEVSDQKFYFDLDADGKEDKISYLNSGSGFLALDHNGDGIINDGSELFGTKSGNGFDDLAKYDSDGNGWIDEADEVFDKLRIWVKDEKGNDQLYKLKDKGVGAICLENVNTNFSQKSQDNKVTNGIIRHTGMFLYEDGRAGTMQHLDMAT